MNRFYLLPILITLFFIALVPSCKKGKKSFAPTTTTVQGKIRLDDAHPPLVLSGIREYQGTLDSLGNFYFQISLSEAGIYKLVYGFTTKNIYIEPGDHMSIDFTSTPDYIFSGSHTLENQFLQAFNAAKNTWHADSIELIYNLSESDFIRKTEERTQFLVDFQQTYQKEQAPFTEIFAELIADEIAYDASIFKMNYPFYYKSLNPDSVLILSDTYDTFLQNIELDDEQMLLVPSFKPFLSLYLDFVAELDTLSQNSSLAVFKYKLIADHFSNKVIKEYLYYDLMKATFEQDVDEAMQLKENYLKVQSNETYIQAIKDLSALWSPLTQGQPAPSWTYKDHKGKKVSLESLRGDVVYIDVWASWCGPCIKEIPYLKELQLAFHKQKISFVSISIDHEVKSWRKAIQTHQLKGIQLLAPNDWDSDLVQNYLISGIPRFILIDKNGNIIHVNAPRPSDKKIHDLLNEALNQE